MVRRRARLRPTNYRRPVSDERQNAATTALAVELAPIRVNAVAPGIVRTPLWDALSGEERDETYVAAAQRLPLGRIGEVEDAARAYLYCMEQSYGTGTVLTVDGGTVLV
jgi:NAD(P)-dependent dehydrogenase (short-subunit alcohol dehydrogenase family)